MYRDHKIALVIPAQNKELLLPATLEGVPELVDKVFVVDDVSSDNTSQVIKDRATLDPRVHLIQHTEKTGPGGGIISGYIAARDEGFDLVLVVGGDNQMDLSEAKNFLDPLIDQEIDYTKGNRFMMGGNAFEDMPAIRLLGNTLISFLTKVSSGYYKTFDVVDGYTGLGKRALNLVPWEKAWKRYGYPMDFLIRLNTYGCKIKEIPRRAIYLEGERQSQIKGIRYALSVSPMIIRGFFRRLFVRYILRDFHPLIFFYIMALFLIPTGFAIGAKILWNLLVVGAGATTLTGILCALCIIMGFQSLLFAMLFDMQESS
jgi:glycosyltransferase involved in cell wall biosynthesis